MLPANGTGRLPSTPILPSPSLSAAFKNALVSLSVRSRPSLAKPFRTNLREGSEMDQRSGFFSNVTLMARSRSASLELLLLDEAAVVGIQHREDLLHLVRRLGLQTHHFEKLLVVEGVGDWRDAHGKNTNVAHT